MMNTIKQGTNERRHDGGALPKGQADNEMKEEKGHLCQKKKKKKEKKRGKRHRPMQAGSQPFSSQVNIERRAHWVATPSFRADAQAFRYVVACTPSIHLRHNQASVPLVFGLLFSNLVCTLG
jgi:hypothetical protein